MKTLTQKEKKAAYYQANRDKTLARVKLYAQNNKAKIKAYREAYNAANKEKIAAGLRDYTLRHREKIARYKVAYKADNPDHLRKWAEANPERWRDLRTNAEHRRRARKRSAAVGIVDLKIVRQRNGLWCGICKQPIEGKFQYDHIIPLSRGGSHSTKNLQLAHGSCNSRKKDKLPLATDLIQGDIP